MKLEETKTNQPEPTQKPKLQKAEKVSPELYEKYCSLKTIKLDGGILKDEVEKEFVQLEEKIKKCEGKVSRRTETASFGAGRIIKLYAGIPVPEEIYNFIRNTGHVNHYF